jgi:serine/threonine protein kinase
MQHTSRELIGGFYRATRRIASGGIGEVWLGIDTRSGRRVALKRLLPEAARHPELAARFEREARVLDRVRSDFVARGLDFIDDHVGGPVLVQQFVPGPPLAAILGQRLLSVDEARELAFQLLLGLIALERARIVHCDYKPGNIILQPLPNGGHRPVLIDFGASRLLDLHPQDLDGRLGHADRALGAVSNELVVGTLEYMAPEQLSDPGRLCCSADLYALGAILYRALHGQHVFGALRGAELVRAKLTREAPRLGARAEPAAEQLEQVIGRALRRRRAERYQHAEDMLADLMATGVTTVMRRSPTPPPLPPDAFIPASRAGRHARPPRPRHANQAAAAVLVVGLSLGVLAFGLSPRRQAAAATASEIAICQDVASEPAAEDLQSRISPEQDPRTVNGESAAQAVLEQPEAQIAMARMIHRRREVRVAQIADAEMPLLLTQRR